MHANYLAIFNFLSGKKWLITKTTKGLYLGDQQDYVGTGVAFYKKHRENELLYRENLVMKATNRKKLNAFKEYIYRYCPELNKLGVFFVDYNSDGNLITNRLFHDMVLTNDSASSSIITGYGNHLCRKDLYKTAYFFDFTHKKQESFSLTHTVKGKNKNYTQLSLFSRC